MTAAFIAARVPEFSQLKELLNISYDNFLSTSLDSRHAPFEEAGTHQRTKLLLPPEPISGCASAPPKCWRS
jgi:hypothetical protein